MKIYIIICLVITFMNYLGYDMLEKRLKREGYKLKYKTPLSEKILGFMLLPIMSFIPIWNILHLYVNIFKQDEMYEKMKNSDRYVKENC